MGYEIHLERVDEDGEPTDDPISLSEWKTAVENTENVRLVSEDTVITNPSTGEVISFPNAGGDAVVFFPAESQWVPIYRWNRGRISFRGEPSFDEPDDVVRQTTERLAKVLKAKIVGDSGEFY